VKLYTTTAKRAGCAALHGYPVHRDGARLFAMRGGVFTRLFPCRYNFAEGWA